MCREHGISEQTYYRWKKEFGMMDANQLLGMEILQEALEKKL